jgi:hypothetical protein
MNLVWSNLGASAANGHLRIRIARLCYDTQHVEAMTFPVDIPVKPLLGFVGRA